ncbi:PAS domain S-box protein [Nitrosomonas sp.]|uniref:PAS domain S-box protein n=1 Tax=Nitrosomonas sp. TaxID=42353 RepID=UPI00271ACBC3|nr:PAS domain S-box protein [Nitrosomonas sp.]MDO8895150.1 PAS domain S-box protein [Nitrosomonas sp.]
MSSNDQPASYRHYIFQLLVLAALYFTFGHISFLITVSHFIVTPVFFVAEGIALAAIILLGRKVWPGIFLGQLALALSTGLEFLPSLTISAINSIEAVIGATLFKRWKLDSSLSSVHDFSRLAALIFLILQPFSATLGTATLLFFNAIPESQNYLQVWAYWWFGNCLGQLLVTPFLLILFSSSGRIKSILQSSQSAIVPIVLMLPATWLVFGNSAFSSIALTLVIYVPLLLWIAIKSGLAAVSLICSGVTTLALYETSYGFGPFVVDGNPHIFDMNIFVLGISFTAQFVSVLFAERNRVEAELRKSEANLFKIIDTSPIPKAICDEHENIIFMNRSFTKLFGYVQEDIPTLTDWGLKAYPDSTYREWVTTSCTQNIEKALLEKTDIEPFEVVIQRKDGSQLSVISTVSLFESSALVKKILITFVDITERKNLESKLILNYKFLEDLSNNIPGFLYQFQLFPDGRSCLPYVSRGIIDVLGIPPEKLISDASPVFSLIHSEDSETLNLSIQESLNTLNDWYSEFRVVTAQNEIKWIHAQSKPEKQNDGSTIWNGYATDITELKNISLKFEALLDLASDGVHILDEDGNIVEFSRSFATMLGYSFEETAQLNVMDWDAMIPKEKLISAVREVSKTPRVFETLHRRKDGTIFDVEINARRLEISGKKLIYASSRDITSRKQQSKELEYQRLRLSNIIEGTHIGTWEWNVQTGEVIFNQRWAEIIGYSLDELAPTSIETWLKFAHPDDLKQSEALLNDHFSGKIPYYECEARMQHRAGHWIWVLDRGRVSNWTDDDKPLMMFGTHQDITSRKERETMLIHARQQAEAASIAKTRFLAMMSHEIRTPMNAVLGMAYLLSKSSLDSQQSAYLRNIEGSSKILLGVINDILDYSKIEANKIELDNIPFDLNNILENLSAMASIAAKDKAVDVLFYVAPNVPRHFTGDPLRLSQIFVNLTNNAIKFTDQGEVIIRITIESTEDSETITLAFSVTDSGIGITSEQMADLFKAFSQADSSITRRFGGTGLGLSISHRLAQQMNGDIVAESHYGKGSRFHCTVQLHRIDHHQDPWIFLPDPLRSLKVMIIDDHATTRAVLSEIVQSLGWNAVANSSYAEALKQLADPDSLPFDLLLFTTHLANTGYRETIHAIEVALPDSRRPKIILITSNLEDPLFSKENEIQGMISVLIKPFTPLSLVDTAAALFSEAADKGNQKQGDSVARKQFAGAHILITEDNEVNQLLISDLLTNLGVTVNLAKNGVECLDLLRTSESHPFDLIFMDIQMPEMDGLEATQQIRQDLHLTDMPIIALTANTKEHDQQEFMKAGMNAFLPKPFNPDQLNQILDRFLKKNNNDQK